MKKIFELNEAELEETFSRSSGPGGQNVNKVATRVTLRHIPTNISVTVQEARSQAQNRQLARERLLAALEEREYERRRVEQDAREKHRRQTAPRPRAVKRRMVEGKRRRAQTKESRRRVADD